METQMIKTLVLKRLIALGFTLLVTAVVPFLTQDRPRLAKVWGKYGPVIVDTAKERINDHIDKID